VLDREGIYTASLVVSCAGISASATVRIQAIGCGGAALGVHPVSLTVHPGDNMPLQGFGGTGTYAWTLATDASGGSLSSTTGPGVVYHAGPAPGTDSITMSDPWCGTISIGARVVAGTLPYAVVVLSPTTEGATSVRGVVSFDTPINQAEYCLDGLGPPGSCTIATPAPDGMSATFDVATGTLPAGDHFVYARGRNAAG
jgi:hypothetical protein